MNSIVAGSVMMGRRVGRSEGSAVRRVRRGVWRVVRGGVGRVEGSVIFVGAGGD